MRFCLACLLLLPTAALFISCQTKSDRGSQSYAELSRQYLDFYYESHPETAVFLGKHQFDGKLNVPTKGWWQQQRTQLAQFDSVFAVLDTAGLSANDKIDLRLIRANIGSQLNDIDSLNVPANPYTYNVDFSAYVERTFGTPTGRMQSVINKARLAPDYVEAVKQNINELTASATAPEHAQVAIDALTGTAEYLLTDVPAAFDTVGNSGQRTELQSATRQASDALRGLATYLEKTVLPRATGTYAIGKGNFRRMLLYNEQLDADPDSLLRLGMAQLKREQIAFANAARIIDPTRSPIDVFRGIQKDHPTAETLVSSTQAHCEAIRQFLLDKQLISIPSQVRATVTKTPEFMVGSTAAMNTPGPFEEPKAAQAYYYITLPKAKWPAKQREEWLTQYNRYVAEVISIHEAYPGHYVQFLHLNASTVSEVRKVFSSYAFVEGWAHYTEQMMLEEGYPNPATVWRDPKTAAKYHMAQLSESLLRYCRLVCAINLHTHGWTVEQATRFIQANCYYEETPAREEALRGTYDPGYLSYSLGKLQLLALREQYRQKAGKNFTLRRFHDDALAHGMLPISELGRIIL